MTPDLTVSMMLADGVDPATSYLYVTKECAGCCRTTAVKLNFRYYPAIQLFMCDRCWEDAEGYCDSFDGVTTDRLAAWLLMVSL